MVLVPLEFSPADRARDSLQVLPLAGLVRAAARAVLRPVPRRLELDTASLAGATGCRLTLRPCVLTVLNMPLVALFGTVPFDSERPDSVKVIEKILFFPGLVAGMDDAVLGWREKLEVRRVVVERVLVVMVDVPLIRDDLAGVRVEPDIAMQVLDAAGDATLIVDPVIPARTVRVAPVLAAFVENVRGGFFHPERISPHTKASSRVHPRVSVQIR